MSQLKDECKAILVEILGLKGKVEKLEQGWKKARTVFSALLAFWKPNVEMKAHLRRPALCSIFLIVLLAAGAASAQSVSLSGSVRDNDANPIPGAEVNLLDTTTHSVVTSALTGADGAYSLLTAAGIYDVVIVPPDPTAFQTATALGVAITTDTILNFVLVPPGVVALSGRLLDALGNGVPNVRMTLLPVAAGTAAERYTDATGHYSLQVAPGDYNLSILYLGWAPSPNNLPGAFTLGTTSPLSLTESRVLDLPLPFKRVAMHVQDPTGADVANVALRADGSYAAWNAGGASFLISSGYPSYLSAVYTDAYGNGTLWLFPNGLEKYVITAAPPEGNPYAFTTLRDVEVVANTDLTLVLANAVSLSGRLLDALGNGVPNVRMTLLPVAAGTAAERYTDATGHYSLQVAPGDYNLSILYLGWAPSPNNLPGAFTLGTTSPLSLTENRVLDLPLPFKRVAVHVQDPTGAAVANVALRADGSYAAWNAGGASFLIGSGYPSYLSAVSTDADGNGTLWLFPNGPEKYVITAAPPPETPYAFFSVRDVTVEQDMNVVIVLGLAGPPQPNACPLSQGFWKNHREIWPVESLKLGSRTYTLAEVISLLQLAPKGDASLIVAHQLIAAKSNIYWGSDPAPITGTIAAMDSLLATYPGTLPYQVRPGSAAGGKMIAAAAILDNYNNAALTPTCNPAAPTLALTGTERDIAELADRTMMAAHGASLGHFERMTLKAALDGARFNRFDQNRSRAALLAFVEQVKKLLREGKLAQGDARDLADRAGQILAKMK